MSRAAAENAQSERRQKQRTLRIEMAQRDVTASLLLGVIEGLASSLDALLATDAKLAADADKLGLEDTPVYDRVVARVAAVIDEALRA